MLLSNDRPTLATRSPRLANPVLAAGVSRLRLGVDVPLFGNPPSICLLGP